MSGRWRVAVATPTFKRPATLEQCLTGVAAMVQPDEPVDLVVLVVDNDPEGSAGAAAESCRQRLGLDLRYCVEPERGLVAVRNRLVAEATAAGATHLLFIDDDETPRPDFLSRVVGLMRSTGATVVQGTSSPQFEVTPPGWMVEGRFFERHDLATGTQVQYNFARTSGVLIEMAAIAALEPPVFHPVFALSSGEDVDLFLRLTRNGGRIVWCNEAVVDELVPASRTSAAWLVKRSFRVGTTQCAVWLLRDQPSLGRRLKRMGRGVWKCVTGAVSLAWAWTGGTGAVVRARQKMAYGAGVILGVRGFRYQEYKTTHAR